MPNKIKSLIAGSTGLVGSLILEDLRNKDGEIVLVSRKKNDSLPENASEIIINFDNLLTDSVEITERIDHVYLCLGKKLSTYELVFMPVSNRNSFKRISISIRSSK